MHELGAVMSRKRNYSTFDDEDNLIDIDNVNITEDGVAAKRGRSSSSSDDDLPPAFTGKDTPAAGCLVKGGRVLRSGKRRKCGITSSLVPPLPSVNDLRNVDDDAEDTE